jgi:hypothetical protein
MIISARFYYKCRVLTKGASAEVQFSLRNMQVGGVSSVTLGIPLETFVANKDMGRVLIRRGGETIAAGMLKSLQIPQLTCSTLVQVSSRRSMGNSNGLGMCRRNREIW